jgi:hypothetical protein
MDESFLQILKLPTMGTPRPATKARKVGRKEGYPKVETKQVIKAKPRETRETREETS